MSAKNSEVYILPAAAGNSENKGMRSSRHMSVRTCVRPDMCPSGHVSVRTCVRPDMCPSGHVSVRTCVRPDMCPSGHVSVRTCVRPDMCPSSMANLIRRSGIREGSIWLTWRSLSRVLYFHLTFLYDRRYLLLLARLPLE